MNTDVPDHTRSRGDPDRDVDLHDPQYPALPAVANSVNGLHKILTDPTLCGWPAARASRMSATRYSRQVEGGSPWCGGRVSVRLWRPSWSHPPASSNKQRLP